MVEDRQPERHLRGRERGQIIDGNNRFGVRPGQRRDNGLREIPHAHPADLAFYLLPASSLDGACGIQDFVALHTGYLLLAAAKSHYNTTPRILAYLIQPVLHLPADLS
jgi:hypothetical protein